jgi:hypothetical protein
MFSVRHKLSLGLWYAFYGVQAMHLGLDALYPIKNNVKREAALRIPLPNDKL